MCYTCHELSYDPSAPKHSSIKCKLVENKYSGYYTCINGVPNKYCIKCKTNTHHIFKKINNKEKLFCYLCYK